MSWEQVKLGEIFEIARGGSPRPIDQYITDDPNGLNWISIKDASNSSKYIYKTEKKIKPEGLHKTRLVHPDDFILTNSMSFGRPYIMKTTGCIHDGWLVLSADKTKVDTDYFYHLLGSDFMYRKFAGLAAGAVVKNLNTELVKSVSVPLPPLAAQRRIASILDQADELRQKRQQAIEKLDQLLQATFIDMFGDPVSNPKGWEAKPIDNICANIVDCVNKTAPIVEYETPYKMIRTTNVRNHKVDISSVRYVEKETFDKWNRRLTPKRGDVILTREAPVGEVGILESDDSVFLGQRLMLYRVNLELTTPEYLLYFLMSDNLKMQYEQMSSGSTVKHLSVPQCSKWSIYLPPLELQLKFSEFYKMIHANLELMRISYNKADTLFKSLQNQAFSGTL